MQLVNQQEHDLLLSIVKKARVSMIDVMEMRRAKGHWWIHLADQGWFTTSQLLKRL